MRRLLLVVLMSFLCSVSVFAETVEIMDGLPLPFKVIPREQSVSKNKGSTAGYPQYHSYLENRLFVETEDVVYLRVDFGSIKVLYDGKISAGKNHVLLSLPEHSFGEPVKIAIERIRSDGNVEKFLGTYIPVDHVGLSAVVKITGDRVRFTTYLVDKDCTVYLERGGKIYRNGVLWEVDHFGFYNLKKFDYLWCPSGMFVQELASPFGNISSHVNTWNAEDGNCYSYALGSKGERLFPGYREGMESSQLSLVERVGIDCPLMTETTLDEAVPEGWKKIAIVESQTIYEDSIDYHFYVLQEDGSWWHKPGITGVTNVDYSGQVIYDPRIAIRCSSVFFVYDDFLGFYHIPGE